MPRGKGKERTTRPLTISCPIQIADKYEQFCRKYKIDRNQFAVAALMSWMKEYEEKLREIDIEKAIKPVIERFIERRLRDATRVTA